MIKSFEDYWDESGLEFVCSPNKDFYEEAYEAAVKSSKDHYEMDRLLIHKYYTKKVRELVGNDDEEIIPYEANNGKLT